MVQTSDDGIDAVIDFGDGGFVGIAVDFGEGGIFGAGEGFNEILGILDGFFKVGGGIIRDDDEERSVHNVGFLGKNVDKVDVIVHKNAEEHIIGVAAQFGKIFDVGANIDALVANQDLSSESEGV